jgi:hypothetical protein
MSEGRLLDRFVGVLQWLDVTGKQLPWQEVVDAIAAADGLHLLGLATQWNALIQGDRGQYDPAQQGRIVRTLAAPEYLAAIDQAISRKVVSTGWPHSFPPPILSQQTLLMLASLALRVGLWDDDGETLDGPGVIMLLLGLNDHLEPPPLARRAPPAWNVVAMMIAMWDLNHRQSPEGLTRMVRMLREYAPQSPQARRLPELFERATALTVEDYLTLVFSSVIMTSHLAQTVPAEEIPVHGELGLANVAPRQLLGDSTMTIEKARRFLDALSMDASSFRDQLAGTQPVQTNFTLFRAYPLLRLTPDLYRIIDRSFMMNKLAEGPFWETHQGARLAGVSIQDVNGWWGGLFDRYVHELVRASLLAAFFTAAPAISAPGANEGADGLLEFPDALIVLESKVSPLPVGARSAADPRFTARELHKKFGSKLGTGQLARAVATLLDGGTLGGIRLDQRDVFPVLVCWDSAMDAPVVNYVLHRWFRRRLTRRSARVMPLTVMSIDTFEWVLAQAGAVPLQVLLREWATRDPTMRTSPRIVFEDVLAAYDNEPNPWVAAAAKSWQDEMLSRLWPHGETATRLRGERSTPEVM